MERIKIYGPIIIYRQDTNPVIVFPIKDLRKKSRADFETDFTAKIRIENDEGKLITEEILNLDAADTKNGTWLYFPSGLLQAAPAGVYNGQITVTDTSNPAPVVQTVNNLIRFNVMDKI